MIDTPFSRCSFCWNRIPSSDSLKRKNPSLTDHDSHISKRPACHLMNDNSFNHNRTNRVDLTYFRESLYRLKITAISYKAYVKRRLTLPLLSILHSRTSYS
ncbi:hypothetical protein H4Q26_007953 [Puccinia striiformis f. sp. tritici PST-130]|nr:hypothetical protein H4Q26_007953 [Puccinia striiformis f. sp. tritici PST-130]